MKLKKEFIQSQIGDGGKKSIFISGLIALLNALSWPGDDSILHEAMPLNRNDFGINELLETMSNLDYKATIYDSSLKNINNDNIPCLFYNNSNELLLILKGDEDSILIFNTLNKKYEKISKSEAKGKTFYFYKPIDSDLSLDEKQPRWFSKVISKFSNLFVIVFAVSLLLTVLTLLVPLFIILIFSQVSSGTSAVPLINLSYGVSLYIIAIFILSFFRSHIFSYLSARVGYILDNYVMKRILYIPISFTENADTGVQLARIKDFQAIERFLSGRIAGTLVDLPFLVIIIAALFVIGGPIGFIPIAAIIVFLIFGKIINPFVKALNIKSSDSSSKRHNLTVEVLSNYDAIKETNSEDVWLKRYVSVTKKNVRNSLGSEKLITFINNFTAFLVSASGLATITAGAVRVINGDMSAGALMASMVLTWKILNPLRNGFSVLSQINKIVRSVAQIDRLMNLNIECKASAGMFTGRSLRGNIVFDQVSIRYLSDAQPALLGVSFDLKNGEILQIRGHDGAGKSTILKLILSLYTAQAGRVLIDDINTKQINPIVLRKMIGFVPENCEYINGTIAENITGFRNDISLHEIRESAKTCMILDEIEALPDKFDTKMTPYLARTKGQNFLKKMNFCRVLIKKSNILLLDEVNRFFDEIEMKQFIEFLKKSKRSKTIIVVSNSDAIKTVADKVLQMDYSKVNFFGKANEYKSNI